MLSHVMLKVVSDGVLRGAGDMGEFMVTTFTDLLLRVIFSYILSKVHRLTGICWAFPIGSLANRNSAVKCTIISTATGRESYNSGL